MLAAPPAAAMMKLNDSRGLEPSVYGGGASSSSGAAFEDCALVSGGSAAFVSASTLDPTSSSARASSKEGAGADARSESQAVPVIAALMRSSSASVGKLREEKGGGRCEGGLDDDASDLRD